MSQRGFKAKATIVRELKEITIIFYDSDTIYVYPKNSKIGCLFHKWGTPLGFYTNNWLPFRRKMMRTKNLTMIKCHQLALEYEIMVQSTGRKLELKNKKVIKK